MGVDDMKLANNIKAKLVIMGFDTRQILTRVSGSTVTLSGSLEKVSGGVITGPKRLKALRQIETTLQNVKEIRLVRLNFDD